MIRNFIKIALRIMMRNKSYSFINIFGLSMGVACCILLALYIHNEFNYDKHHRNADNLYRIITHFHGDINAGISALAKTSPPIAMAMSDEVPEVVSAARILSPLGTSHSLIKFGENAFYENEGYIADSTLFEILTYEFIEGNPVKALVEVNSVVITDRIARKLFANEPALNEVISIALGNEPRDYKVTGVIRENKNSHINPNFIISMTSEGGFAEYVRSDEAMGEWAGQNFIIAYIKLREGSPVAEVISKMNTVLNKYGAKDMKALGFTKTLSLEPLKDIYLRSDIGRSPRINTIYVIASIAVFVLMIACINFMNLATAKATKRANEIGLRKVMGAFRSSLITQILAEAMMTVLIAILLSILLAQLALPLFNLLADKNISFSSDNIVFLALALLLIILFTGVFAGSYPAFYISSFQPAHVLKGKFNPAGAAGYLRKSLVVFQFMIAIILSCGMVIISKQLRFMQQKDMGFEAQNKVVLPLRTEHAKKAYSSLKNELLRNSQVEKVSGADYVPGTFVWNDLLLYNEGSSREKSVYHPLNDVDYDYMDVLDIGLLTGRGLTDNREAEQNNIIVNQASLKAFGYTPEEVLGKDLYMDWQGKTFKYEVIGVMEDYHQTSLKEAIRPIAFRLPSPNENQTFENMIVSIEGANTKAALDDIKNTWESVVQDTPFEYSFLDQDLQKLYTEDQRLGKIITSFTVIAMLISCLGLYGLSSYMAERRFKEIGIRKVMGASANQIVALMSGEFVRLVIIALVVAAPLAWYGITKWLEGFAYKTSIDVLTFVIAGAAALLIALATVSFESIRAASTNPVNALRNE